MTANLKPVKIPQSLLLNKDLSLNLKCLNIYLLTCAMKCSGYPIVQISIRKIAVDLNMSERSIRRKIIELKDKKILFQLNEQYFTSYTTGDQGTNLYLINYNLTEDLPPASEILQQVDYDRIQDYISKLNN